MNDKFSTDIFNLNVNDRQYKTNEFLYISVRLFY